MASGESSPSAITGLVVPLVIWGSQPPENKMTVVRFLSDRTTVVTGNFFLNRWLKTLLIIYKFCRRFISASADGQICLWDMQDGRCIDSISTIYVHRFMQSYMYKSSRHTRSTRLFCVGDYSDIVVIDPQDLTVVFHLNSRVEPDWICSYAIVQRFNRPDQCIGLSMAGMIKIWSLVELEKKDMANSLYEDESKRLDIRDVRAVSFNPVNERIYLVVSSSNWQNYFGVGKPFEIAILEGVKTNLLMWLNEVSFSFAPQKDIETTFQVARASRNGQLLIWRIPRYDREFMRKFTSSNQLPLKYKGTFEESLSAVWKCLNGDPNTTMPVMDSGVVTCSLFVGSQGKLLLGRDDGVIVMTYACETLSRQLLDVPAERPTSRRLIGHRSAVRNLFYPHEHHSRFDIQVLLSGGDDFSVIVWNINTAVRLYRFTVHGGPIERFIVPPANASVYNYSFDYVGSLIGGIMNIDSSEEALTDGRSLSQVISKTDPSDANSVAGLSRRLTWQFESNLYLDVARLLLSLLHAWNLDEDLDSVCSKKLALNKPRHQLYFGNVSRHGQLSVVLPQRIRRSFDSFSTDVRWQASHSLTTTHLLAVISTANTLMGMRNATTQIRLLNYSRSRRSVAAPQPSLSKHPTKENPASERQQIKQGWSLLAALHCVLLPDHVRPKSSYAAPRIELLARRWQDSCVEIREAAQALLIRELSRLGATGRRRLIESWAPFLPPLLDPALSIFGARLQSSVPALPPSAPPIPPRQKHLPPPVEPVPESGVQQVRRNQATAIILLGVVGAEFGDELNRLHDIILQPSIKLFSIPWLAPYSNHVRRISIYFQVFFFSKKILRFVFFT
uniref:WD_REPEATS_REGION domain-containing protein n=1 Tax=Heterorhabditis bacteriophora TaxID=37862 RepID=A0A1I7XSF6_HETBA